MTRFNFLSWKDGVIWGISDIAKLKRLRLRIYGNLSWSSLSSVI